MIYVDNFMNCGLGWVGMFLGLMVVLNRGYNEFFFDNSDICCFLLYSERVYVDNYMNCGWDWVDMFLELLVVLIKENYVFFLGYNYFELSFLVIYFVSLLECYLKDYIDEFKFVFIFCSRLLFLLNRDEDDEFS